MKRRSFVLFLSALTMSAALIGTSPVLAETKETTEAADSKDANAKDADTKDSDAKDTADSAALEDGVYTAEFDTDSSMFHVNEANDKKGTLTVKDGKMTIHVSLVSKKIVNLFAGTAEDAAKDGAEILDPTTDTVNTVTERQKKYTASISLYLPLMRSLTLPFLEKKENGMITRSASKIL